VSYLPLFSPSSLPLSLSHQARNSRAVSAEELKRLLSDLESEVDHNSILVDDAPLARTIRTNPNPKHCSFHLDEVPPLIPPATFQIRRVVAEAITLSAQQREVLVVCGTAFIMSDVRALLGIQEPRDDLDHS
jgi:hypothetical protein